MQTYTQTFAGAQTWVLNIPGSYFVTLQCTNAINVRLYRGGKKLDLGDMTGLLAGLEIGPLVEPGQQGYGMAFDRVEVDVTGADTIKVGIGNGAARYNRSNGTVDVNSLPQSSILQLIRPEQPTNNWVSNAAFVANTAVQIFAAGVNPNGVILHACDVFTNQTGNDVPALIAKASAPANVGDGEVIALGTFGSYTGFSFSNIKLMKPERIAAGLGLYLITTSASVSVTPQRSARWTPL